MNWNTLAIVSQFAVTGWMALTHWVSLPPLNNLRQAAFPNERVTNLTLHTFQLASIVGFMTQSRGLMWTGCIFWTAFMAGHLLSWWLPYFFGWPKAFLKNTEMDNAKTYHFLPARKNHPIPDLNHCILGVLTVSTLIIAWKALFLT